MSSADDHRCTHVSTDQLLVWMAELTRLHGDLEQVLIQSRPLLAALAASGEGVGPGYGALTESLAEEAAAVVDRRREVEFAAASFDGQTLRAQAALVHLVANLRTLAEDLGDLTSQAHTGATGALGSTIRTVVEVTQSSLSNPLARDTEELRTIAGPLLGRVEAHHRGIQQTRNRLERLRTAVAEAEAEKQRLSEQLRRLGASPPLSPSAPPSPPRRRRRKRRR